MNNNTIDKIVMGITIKFVPYIAFKPILLEIKIGTKAPEAAGKIHTDIQRGFMRAEVVSYDDLIKEGSMNAVKEKGLLRSEGKEYVMQDGDVVLFRFNV